MIVIFDRGSVARNRRRAAASSEESFFLFDWSVDQIEDRLSVIRRQFPLALRIGARGKALGLEQFGIASSITMDVAPSEKTDIVAEEDFLPIAPSSADLIYSPLSLHSVNDLPGALLQIRQALKPDGVFIAALAGGETLYELRACLQEAELEITGGVSPRISPFADKQQMGSLLQRAGFSLPVVDSDIVTVTYESTFALMRDLRAMGETNAISERKKTFSSRRIFFRAAELYAQKFSEPDGRIRASFEIIFLLGWSPHESQQKPLRPGSAEFRLSEALGTTETGTGEKPH